MDHLLSLPTFITLSDLFIVFNLGRVLFYLPSFMKMKSARNNLDSHSLITWFCWIFANITTGLVFYVQSGELDVKVGLIYANALMCSIGFGLILYKRRKFKGISESDRQEQLGRLERENEALKGVIRQLELEGIVGHHRSQPWSILTRGTTLVPQCARPLTVSELAMKFSQRAAGVRRCEFSSRFDRVQAEMDQDGPVPVHLMAISRPRIHMAELHC